MLLFHVLFIYFLWLKIYQCTSVCVIFYLRSHLKIGLTNFIGYIEPVMVILHERELTWAGRVSWNHHTCMISALSISTTLKQHPLIWSAVVSSM